MTEYIGAVHALQAVTVQQLVLASTSPTRRRLLEGAGVAVKCLSPAVDESTMTQPEPGERALARARAKALAVPRHGDEIALGADQVAYDPSIGECFGKPRDDEDHAARLRALRGRDHLLFTAYWVAGPGGERSGVAVARVHLRADLEDGEIDRYVACGEARGCAGGYAVEGRGAFLIDRIDGDWTGVLGLPLYDVLGALRALGWRFHG